MKLFCVACRTMVEVTDTHHESVYDGGAGGAAEYGYTVNDLACGHESTGSPVELGPAPGVPYTGHRSTATVYATDLAQSRQEVPEWD